METITIDARVIETIRKYTWADGNELTISCVTKFEEHFGDEHVISNLAGEIIHVKPGWKHVITVPVTKDN